MNEIFVNRDGIKVTYENDQMLKKHPSIEFIINTDGIDDALKHLNVMIEKLKEANSLADELTSKLVQEKEIALDGKLITFPLGNRD